MIWSNAILPLSSENSWSADRVQMNICKGFGKPDRTMNELDLLITAHRYLSSIYGGCNIWSKITGVKEIIPLQDPDGTTRAYSITFFPAGYAMINNNRNHPVAIAFGEDSTPPTEWIIRDRVLLSHRLHEILDGDNKQEMNQHRKERSMAIQYSKKKAKKYTYDFIDWEQMPKGSYSSGDIPFAGITWAVMKDFNDIARNHCGAAAATNIALLLGSLGNPALKKNNSVKDTFVDLHGRIGNGPAMLIAGKLRKYAESRGHALAYSPVLTYNGIKKAVSDNRPCGLLLSASLLHDWHWVTALGWRQYHSGGNYVRIVTGWSNSANNFCLFHGKAAIGTITQYSITK